MGLYGTTTPAFADQFSRMLTYKMEPLVSGDYGPKTNVRSFRGAVRQYSAPPTAEGVKVHVPSFQGFGTGNATLSKKPFLWTNKELPIGDFVSWKKDVYRVLSENIFTKETGLCVQGLEKVVGLNGSGSTSLPFNFGENNVN
jgi:hypothetical protein